MRKPSLAVTLVAVVSLFAIIQIACQPAADTNRSDSLTPPTNANRQTVDTAAIEAELLRIERDWPRVVKEKDVAAVGRVEADDAIFVYADGSVGNKQRDLADISRRDDCGRYRDERSDREDPRQRCRNCYRSNGNQERQIQNA